jgi:hypothetical protein
MIYVFKDSQLIYQGEHPPHTYPLHSYVYVSWTKSWSVKYDRNYLRPIKDKHLPKELKLLCLLYNISLN